MIETSPLSIGSLFCYLGVIAIAVPFVLVALIRALAGLKSKLQGGGFGLKSAQ